MDRESTVSPTPGDPDEPPGRDGEGTTADTNVNPPSGLLGWPPPDLARIQGEIWGMVVLGGLGSLILVPPLLSSVAVEHGFWSLGAFGESWWVLVLTTSLGLLIVLSVFGNAYRLLRRASAATDLGYGRLTILEVITDLARDMGFLIQGARQYEEVPVEARNRLIRYRVLGGLAYLGAAVWVPVGFTLAVILAARGVASPTAIWILALLPAAVLLVVGMAARVVEPGIVKAAERRWIRKTGHPVRLDYEIEAWNERLEDVSAELGIDPGPGDRGILIRTAAVGVIVLFVLVAVPVGTLAFTTALGSQVATLAVPEFVDIQEDAAGVQALRRYVLEPDPTVAPEAAGNALNSLLYVGPDRNRDRLLQPPLREYGEPWFPEDPDGVGAIFPSYWVMEMLERAPGDLQPAERSYLEQVASHPAQNEISTLARADRVDVVGTRWELPFPDSLTLLTLPIPSYGSVRDAAYAHIGKAAFELQDGRRDRAEETLREVVSAGFNLMEEGPVLIDALVGLSLAEAGGEALRVFYVATGRDELAEALDWARQATEEGAALGRVGQRSPDVQALVKEMSELVGEEAVLRGLRWDLLGGFHTLSPCINTHKVVFGPGEDYEAWLQEARASLVRFESEEAFFELAQGGWLGRGGDTGATPSWLRRALVFTLGGERTPGSCATLVSGID